MSKIVQRIIARGREREPFNLNNQHRWSDRATAAVDLWLAHDGEWREQSSRPLHVSDIGAGNGLVGGLLSDRAAYQVQYRGYDLLPQSDGITRLDVRSGLPSGRVDLTLCLGLLEYLASSDPIISRLAEHSRFVITSYVSLEAGGHPLHSWKMSKRRKREWRRHQTRLELRESFIRAGFTEIASSWVPPETDLWLWEARGGSS